MSIGTITRAANEGNMPTAPSFVDRFSFAGDSSYPTGGTTGFKGLLRAKTLDSRQPIAAIAQNCGVYQVAYDYAADKLMVFAADGTQVANATNLSGTTFNIVVLSQ